MCVIIVKPAGATMPEGYLETCYDNNPDGMGYMYAEDGRVVADKFIPESFEEVQALWDMLDDVEAIIHLRWLTTGERVKGHCHPFRILRDTKASPDLFFMHNGTFPVDLEKGQLDTTVFKDTVLKPILVSDPSILHSKKFITMLEGMDTWSRLAFLSGDGHLTMTRERSWVKEGECMLSNNYSTTPGHRDPISWPYYPRNRYTPLAANKPIDKPKAEVITILPFSRVPGANTALVGDTFNPLTGEWESPYVDFKTEDVNTEEVDVLASLPDCDLLTWLKEDFDDAVETLMTKYDEHQLADLISYMGLGFAPTPQEIDVEALVTEYPEIAVEFVKGQGQGWWSHFYAN